MKDAETLSNGFDAGNYAMAYTSTDLDRAWSEQECKGNADPIYRAGYVVGFFSSLEEREIPSWYRKEWREALNS
jgi:hypothetical protein